VRTPGRASEPAARATERRPPRHSPTSRAIPRRVTPTRPSLRNAFIDLPTPTPAVPPTSSEILCRIDDPSCRPRCVVVDRVAVCEWPPPGRPPRPEGERRRSRRPGPVAVRRSIRNRSVPVAHEPPRRRLAQLRGTDWWRRPSRGRPRAGRLGRRRIAGVCLRVATGEWQAVEKIQRHESTVGPDTPCVALGTCTA